MIPVWWSILLAVVGVFGLYITTTKRWWGWAVSLAAQVLWIAYAVATSQPGFILSALAYGTVNLIGLYRWYKPKETS